MSEKKKNVAQEAAADIVAAAEKAAKKITKKKAAEKTEAAEEKKPVRRKKAVPAVVYVQYAGSEYVVSGLAEKVTAAFEAEGNKASAIKSLDIYVKPEEGKAYYVINGEAEGKSVDL